MRIQTFVNVDSHAIVYIETNWDIWKGQKYFCARHRLDKKKSFLFFLSTHNQRRKLSFASSPWFFFRVASKGYIYVLLVRFLQGSISLAA